MKKTIVIVMVLMMLVTMSASAELRYASIRSEQTKLGVKHDGTVIWDEVYFGTVRSESGASVEMEISKAEYEAAYKKLYPKKRNAFQSVCAWVSFWNPDD